jgi:hypothetical protein
MAGVAVTFESTKHRLHQVYRAAKRKKPTKTTAPSDDPIYASIARHSAAAEKDDAVREDEMVDRLLRSAPRTHAGMAALFEHLASPRRPDTHLGDSASHIGYLVERWWNTASANGRETGDDPVEEPAAWLAMLAARRRRLAEAGKDLPC